MSLLFGKRSIVFGVDRLILALFSLACILLSRLCLGDLADSGVHNVIESHKVFL